MTSKRFLAVLLGFLLLGFTAYPLQAQEDEPPLFAPIDATNAAMLTEIVEPLTPEEDGLFIEAQFAPDGSFIAAIFRYSHGENDFGSIPYIWPDLNDLKVVQAFDTEVGDEIRAMTVNPEDGSLITGSALGYVKSWDLDRLSGRQLFRTRSSGGQGFLCQINGFINAVAYSPTSDMLLVGEVGGTLTVLPEETQFDSSISGNTCLSDTPGGIIVDIDWDAAGEYFVVGRRQGERGWFEIWDAETLEVIETFDGFDQIQALRLSPDASMAAVVDAYQDANENWHSKLYLVDIASGERTLLLEQAFTGLAFSNDNTLLAYTTFDATIEIYDVASAEVIATLEDSHELPVTELEFSPDGTLLLSSDWRDIRLWAVPDADSDGVLGDDNCPLVANEDQEDGDDDGVGDACDECPDVEGSAAAAGCPDEDEDGIADEQDNCPAVSNADQADFNDDQTGDACQDSDEDDLLDVEDACPDAAGPAATDGCPDSDDDGIADADDLCPAEAGSAELDGCPDSDDDGIGDDQDNCPAVSNADQADFNQDKVGDACQDTDEDDLLDAVDACPETAGPAETDGCPDSDADGIADVDDLCPDEAGSAAADGCPDADADGIADKEDNCPDVANTDQADFNDDQTGDACQDSDEDTLLDAEDVCPDAAGPTETDGCPDSDDDGVIDPEDACPDDPGAPETDGCPDADGDGVFDAVDECPDEAGMPEVNGCLFTGIVRGTGSNVNIRRGPGTNFGVAGVAAPGETFVILGRNAAGDWLRIRTVPDEGEDALEGWIFADLVATDAPIENLPVLNE